MTIQASLDPNSKHISLGYAPEIPQIATGVDLTFCVPQSPKIQHTFSFPRMLEVLYLAISSSKGSTEDKLLRKGCREFVEVLAKPVFAELNKAWEAVLADACRDYLPSGRNSDKYLRNTLKTMCKAASANRAYRSPDSHRIYDHTIPAEKTTGGIAVNVYFDLPSDIGFVDSISTYP